MFAVLYIPALRCMLSAWLCVRYIFLYYYYYYYFYDYTGVAYYDVKNSYITSKTLILYFDVSISSRYLHQKKLVRSSSESWCDDQLSHQEGGRQNKVLKFWLWYMNFLLRIVIPTKWIYFSIWYCILPYCNFENFWISDLTKMWFDLIWDLD